MNKLIKPYNILDAKTHVAYTKYVKEGGIPEKHKANGREEMRLILRTVCKHIAEGMIEYPGGVFIKKIGYFFNWKPPVKMSYYLPRVGEKSSEKELFNYHTDHYMFFPTYLPMSKKLDARYCWTMDRAFNRSLKKRTSEKIRTGFRYRNYMSSLKKL